MKLRTKELILCALFCALTAVGAQLTIPIPYGAITLQLLFMLLAGLMLPPLMSFLSMAVYVLLGLVGAPVFAGFSGGFSSITSPTFGFVIGLALSAPLISALFRALKKRWKLFPAALVAGLAGILVSYLCGAVYGYFVMTLVLTKEVTLWFILWNWCLIYLPFDAAKLLVAAAITPALFKRIPGLR